MIQINTEFLTNKLYVIILAGSAVIFTVVTILFITRPVTRLTPDTNIVDETTNPDEVSEEYLHDEESDEDQVEEEYVIDEMGDEVYTDDTLEPSL